jgi:hypothetical protein
MNFDERGANAAQRLDAHRLIIDEGARASIRHLHASQNKFAIAFDVAGLGRRHGPVFGGQIENRRNLTLRFADANQCAVSAAAQRES